MSNVRPPAFVFVRAVVALVGSVTAGLVPRDSHPLRHAAGRLHRGWKALIDIAVFTSGLIRTYIVLVAVQVDTGRGQNVRRHRAGDCVTKALTRLLRAERVVADVELLPVVADAAGGHYPLGPAGHHRTFHWWCCHFCGTARQSRLSYVQSCMPPTSSGATASKAGSTFSSQTTGLKMMFPASSQVRSDSCRSGLTRVGMTTPS